MLILTLITCQQGGETVICTFKHMAQYIFINTMAAEDETVNIK